jgi:hypothetical protein
MDFMADELFDGRRIWVLTIVDHFSRESLELEVGRRFSGQDVACVPSTDASASPQQRVHRLPRRVRGVDGPLNFGVLCGNDWLRVVHHLAA